MIPDPFLDQESTLLIVEVTVHLITLPSSERPGEE